MSGAAAAGGNESPPSRGACGAKHFLREDSRQETAARVIRWTYFLPGRYKTAEQGLLES